VYGTQGLGYQGSLNPGFSSANQIYTGSGYGLGTPGYGFGNQGVNGGYDYAPPYDRPYRPHRPHRPHHHHHDDDDDRSALELTARNEPDQAPAGADNGDLGGQQQVVIL
jgi:hypothetical protein